MQLEKDGHEPGFLTWKLDQKKQAKSKTHFCEERGPLCSEVFPWNPCISQQAWKQFLLLPASSFPWSTLEVARHSADQLPESLKMPGAFSDWVLHSGTSTRWSGGPGPGRWHTTLGCMPAPKGIGGRVYVLRLF